MHFYEFFIVHVSDVAFIIHLLMISILTNL